MTKMRMTLLDELAAARRNKKYRGPCRLTDRPDSKDIRPIPREIRAVVALWCRRDRLATKHTRRQKRGMHYVLMHESYALEMIVCDWLRAHYKLGKNSRITPCTKWRCSISFV